MLMPHGLDRRAIPPLPTLPQIYDLPGEDLSRVSGGWNCLDLSDPAPDFFSLRPPLNQPPLPGSLPDDPAAPAFRIRSLHLHHCQTVVPEGCLEYAPVLHYQPPRHLFLERYIFPRHPFLLAGPGKALIFHRPCARLRPGHGPSFLQKISWVLSQARVCSAALRLIRLSSHGQRTRPAYAPRFQSAGGPGP